MSPFDSRVRWAVLMTLATGISYLEIFLVEILPLMLMAMPVVFVCGIVLTLNQDQGLRLWGAFVVFVNGLMVIDIAAKFPMPLMIFILSIFFICGLVLIPNFDPGIKFWGWLALFEFGWLVFILSDGFRDFKPNVTIQRCGQNMRQFSIMSNDYFHEHGWWPKSISDLGQHDMMNLLRIRPSWGDHDNEAIWTEANFMTEFDKHFKFMGFPKNDLPAAPVLRERIGFHDGMNILFHDKSISFFDLDDILRERPHFITLDAAEVEALGYFDRRDYFEARGER